VLDVGCGNGRFGAFLAQNMAVPIAYHGLDNNPALLERARETLAPLSNLTLQLDMRDIVELPPDEGAYDLVALFGVLHHVPGAEQRQMLLRALAERVDSGGLLAFACWRFYEYERFRARIVEWPPDLERETGDYLLDWRRGERAIRYCHYVDDEELNTLAAATGLNTVVTYRADGSEGNANLYVLQAKVTKP
jgi:tRNA (uracil-5-)-methyltransferase TRM9